MWGVFFYSPNVAYINRCTVVHIFSSLLLVLVFLFLSLHLFLVYPTPTPAFFFLAGMWATFKRTVWGAEPLPDLSVPLMVTYMPLLDRCHEPQVRVQAVESRVVHNLVD